jgi:hypothetical protein
MKYAVLAFAICLSACAGKGVGPGMAQRDHLMIVLAPGVPFDGCVVRHATRYDPANLGPCDSSPVLAFDRPARTALLAK